MGPLVYKRMYKLHLLCRACLGYLATRNKKSTKQWLKQTGVYFLCGKKFVRGHLFTVES